MMNRTRYNPWEGFIPVPGCMDAVTRRRGTCCPELGLEKDRGR